MYGPYSESTQGYPYRQPGWGWGWGNYPPGANQQPASNHQMGSFDRSQADQAGKTQRDARQLRIGTADRQRAIDLLREHTTAGRLELEEFEERVATAHNARTGTELDALFTDLPALNNGLVQGQFQIPDRMPNAVPDRSWKVDVRWALLVTFMVALIVSSAASGYPIFPLAIAAFVFARYIYPGRHRWHDRQSAHNGHSRNYQHF